MSVAAGLTYRRLSSMAGLDPGGSTSVTGHFGAAVAGVYAVQAAALAAFQCSGSFASTGQNEPEASHRFDRK